MVILDEKLFSFERIMMQGPGSFGVEEIRTPSTVSLWRSLVESAALPYF